MLQLALQNLKKKKGHINSSPLRLLKITLSNCMDKLELWVGDTKNIVCESWRMS